MRSLAETFTPGQTAALAGQLARQGAGDLSQAFALSGDAPETAKRILQGMELKTNKDFLPAGGDGAEMDRQIAGALAGAQPQTHMALEDAIKSHYAAASSDSRDTSGRLNAVRLANSIAAVTGGADAYNGEEVPQDEQKAPPQDEGDVAERQDNGEEQQTANEPTAEAVPPAEGEETPTQEPQGDSESNNGASLASNLDGGVGSVQVAAAATKPPQTKNPGAAKTTSKEKPNPQLNAEGEKFIKFWETKGKKGPSPTIYNDPAPTVGYGHHLLPGESRPTQPLTPQQMQELFEKDIRERVNPFLKMVTVPLSQEQVNALADYIYNRGGGNFTRRILPDLNAGRFGKVAATIAGDVGSLRQPGNITRHKMQADLFVGKPFDPNR